MKGLFSRRCPPFGRVLLIESGSRPVADRFLEHVYRLKECNQVDVLTCFNTPPSAFRNRHGQVFQVTDPAIANQRPKFLRTLTSTPYDVVAILNTGSGTLRKWKWIIVLFTRAKIVLVPENRDFTFVDYGYLIRFRMKPLRFRRQQVSNLRLVGEAFLVPFMVLYLLLYAGSVQLRRFLRS